MSRATGAASPRPTNRSAAQNALPTDPVPPDAIPAGAEPANAASTSTGTRQTQFLTPGRQRLTRQAQAIEAALAVADGFRTAHELFSTIRSGGDRIGLTTVYRHLTLLADTDRADVVHTADGEAQYRLCGPHDSPRPDEHHHHVVCRKCGRSVEVSGPEVEAWADRVAAAAGYTDITHTVELFGLCPEHSLTPRRRRRSDATG